MYLYMDVTISLQLNDKNSFDLTQQILGRIKSFTIF